LVVEAHILHKRSKVRELVCVNLEIAVFFAHILKEPYDLKGHVCSGISIDHVPQCLLVFIGSRSLLKAEGPVGRQVRQANERVIVLDDEVRGAVKEKEDVEDASSGDVCERGGAIFVEAENWALGVAVVEVDANELALVLPLHHHKRMHARSLTPSLCRIVNL